MEKIVKFSKVIDILLRIQFWILIIAFVAVVLVSVGVYLVPSDLINAMISSGGSLRVNIESFALSINLQMLSTVDIRSLVFGILSIGMVSLIFVFMIVIRLREIMVGLKKGEPFTLNMSKKIKKLAITVILLGLLKPSIIAAILANMFQSSSLEQLLTSTSAIHSVQINIIQSDPTLIMIGLGILLLAKIFEYGNTLQIQSDQTL